MKKTVADKSNRTLPRPPNTTNLIPLSLRLQGLSDPAISEYVAKLRSRFARYALPAEEARSIIDKDMGEKTLSGVLDQMRQEECR